MYIWTALKSVGGSCATFRMMHTSSISAALASIHRGVGVTIRRSFHLLSVSAKRHNPNVSPRPQPYKIILRSFVADTESPLLESEAIGMVATAQANFMRVIVERVAEGDDCSSKTGVELLCVVKALLKKIGMRVLVGDKVLVGSVDWVHRSGIIKNVLHRRSEVNHPPVANVDHLLVLFSLAQPKLEPFTLTRFLVEAESTGIPVTLALNKCELITPEELESWKIRLRGWNYEPLFCSVTTEVGLDAIGVSLRNRTSVIIGPSGVGKSSLINIIRSSFAGDGNVFEHKLGKKWFEDQRVRQVSARNGRGRHTTSNVSLLPLSQGGYIADTPGFNKHKLELLKVQEESLASCFPEIRTEETGCVVNYDWERYPYYVQLLTEIKLREGSQLRKHGTKREGHVRCKVGEMGETKSEPRLDPKMYRRVSRKKMKQTMLSNLEDY